jgi:hypothetical protein
MVNTDHAFICLGIAQIERTIRSLKAMSPKPGQEVLIAQMIAAYEAEVAKDKAWYGIRKVRALA